MSPTLQKSIETQKAVILFENVRSQTTHWRVNDNWLIETKQKSNCLNKQFQSVFPVELQDSIPDKGPSSYLKITSLTVLHLQVYRNYNKSSGGIKQVAKTTSVT